MTTEAKTIKMIKFGGEACSACLAMKKAKTLEKLAEAFGQIEIVELDVNDKHGEAPEGTEYAKNYTLSDEYDAQVLPTLIFEDVETTAELARVEGAASFRDLKGVAEEAIKELEKLRARRARKK